MLITLFETVTNQIHLDNTTSYSGALTAGSSTFSRANSAPGYFYEPIRVTVSVTGVYNIRSISNIDAYGYLYRSAFNPLNVSAHLVLKDDESGGNRQFLITTTLEAGVTYILVVTTYSPNQQGVFTVTVDGPARLGLTRIDGASTATTSASTASTSTRTASPSTTTKVNPVTSESNVTLAPSLYQLHPRG